MMYGEVDIQSFPCRTLVQSACVQAELTLFDLVSSVSSMLFIYAIYKENETQNSKRRPKQMYDTESWDPKPGHRNSQMLTTQGRDE